MLKKLLFLILIVTSITNTCYGKVVMPTMQEDCAHFKEYKKEKYDEDILHMYKHKASGMELIWIENEDTNCSFTLGVRTPTVDSTGVNHIIEHTLFTGSKKYGSSSLFFDASSSYPHTYMNALTTGDMTIFPFSTPYQSAYNALLDIYLDSIFHPNFLEVPYGFYEESFNYSPDEERSGGVVYNEMKGAFSNEERKIYRTIRNVIYKDTHYSHDSGGDPNEIPKLTYKAFVDTYKRYYYPGNMAIILYGDLPIENVLAQIEPYLQEETEARAPVELGVERIHVPEKVKGSVLNASSKCALAKSFVMPKTLSVEEEVQMDLWVNAYLGGQLSPVQRTLQKLGCHEIKILKDDDLPYMMYTLIVKNIPSSKIQAYNAVLDEVLAQITTTRNVTVEEDMLLESQWAQMQVDEDEERSIYIPQTILDGWAHHKAEDQYYMRKEYLTHLKAFKKEICEPLWQEAKVCTFFLLPGENEIVDPMTLTSVSTSEWQDIYPKMQSWQNQKAALEGMPLKDMLLEEQVTLDVTEKEDYTLLQTKVATNFARSQLYYNVNHIKQEDLPIFFLYSYLLEESSKEQTPFKGTLNTNCLAIPDDTSYTPYLKLSILTDKKEKDHGAILKFARENLLEQTDEWYLYKMQKFINNSRATSQNNVLGTLNSLGLGSETGHKCYLYQQGYPLYTTCKAYLKAEDTTWIQRVKEMDQKVYNKEGMIIAITSPYKRINSYMNNLKKDVLKIQNCVKREVVSYDFKKQPQTCFLKCDSAVDYIYMQYTEDKPLTGSDYVMAAYLSKNYLNPKIRIELGAYGAGCNCQYPTSLSLYTYRDPNYQKSSEVIAQSENFLITHPVSIENLRSSQTEALARINGQFRLLDRGLGYSDALENRFLLKLEKNLTKDLQKEIISTTPADIQAKAKIIKDLLRNGTKVIGTPNVPQNVDEYKIYQF